MATLRQLKIFVAVAEYKKMNLAANKLYIAQPTVSQTVIDLEKEYDTVLFERHNKELKITPSGTLLLKRAKEIIALHEGLEKEMKKLQEQRPLKLGATLTIGNTLISDLIVSLNEKYPDIDVSVFIDNTKILEHRMIHNELDLSLVEGIISHRDIQAEPVLDDKLEVVCSTKHPLVQKSCIHMQDLTNQNFIMREQGSGTRAIFENIMATHHIPYITKWECCSSSAILDAVRHNLGLGILSSRCIKEYAQKGEIQVCNIEDLNMKRYFYLCYNQNYPFTSQMRDFTDLVQNLSPEL